MRLITLTPRDREQLQLWLEVLVHPLGDERTERQERGGRRRASHDDAPSFFPFRFRSGDLNYTTPNSITAPNSATPCLQDPSLQLATLAAKDASSTVQSTEGCSLSHLGFKNFTSVSYTHPAKRKRSLLRLLQLALRLVLTSFDPDRARPGPCA